MKRMTGLVLTVGMTVLTLGACGDDTADTAVSSEEPAPGGGGAAKPLAPDTDKPTEVSGHLFVEGDTVRLCAAVAESFPPSCGGSSLTVKGADLASFSFSEAGPVRWTAATVSVRGTIKGGVLTVS